MLRKIAIIDGHPDVSSERFCHVVAEADAAGAQADGAVTKLKGMLSAAMMAAMTASVPAVLSMTRSFLSRGNRIVDSPFYPRNESALD